MNIERLYGSATSETSSAVRRVTIHDLANAKLTGEHWPMLTAYDAITANIFDTAGIPVLLVGDSASMVVHGNDSTLPITVDEMIPLVRAVVRGTSRALIVADLPFGSYQESPGQALSTAVRFMKETGCHAVKLEGGVAMVDHVEKIVSAGIPVMGHIGLTPQSVHNLGGYKVQGKTLDAKEKLFADAKALEYAGAFSIVIECVPNSLTEELVQQTTVPLIGIGAGNATDGQVMVWQDLLGLTSGRTAKFVKKYSDLNTIINDSVTRWANDVSVGAFPDKEHSYN